MRLNIIYLLFPKIVVKSKIRREECYMESHLSNYLKNGYLVVSFFFFFFFFGKLFYHKLPT